MLRSPTITIHLAGADATTLDSIVRDFGQRDGYEFELGGAVEPTDLGWVYSLQDTKLRIIFYRITATAYGVAFERTVLPLLASEVRSVADALVTALGEAPGINAKIVLNP